jgi:single-stranded-DNA-specific exonuclease
MVPTLEADLEIGFNELSLELANALSILEPYGVGNPIPTFVMRGVTVNEISSISGGKHTKLSLGDGRASYTAMFFSQSADATGLHVGDSADVLFTIDINEWMGKRSLQLIVKDIRLSDAERHRRQAELDRFEEVWAGGAILPSENFVPTREDFASLYRLILMLSHQGIHRISHRDLQARLALFAPSADVGYVKLRLMIKVITELNLVGVTELEDGYEFSVRFHSSKTDLEKSGLLRRLRSQQKG